MGQTAAGFTVSLVAIAASVIAAPAAAQDVRLAQPTQGYTHFNKPGATIEDHRGALESCLLDATAVVSWDEMIDNNQGLMAGLLLQGRARAARVAALENCMVVRGWRTVVVPEAEGRVLSELASAELTQWLADRVGAAAPAGTIGRTFANQALDAAHKRDELAPSATRNGALSLLALGATDDLLMGSPLTGSGTRMQERYRLAREPGARIARPLPDEATIDLPRDLDRQLGRSLRPQELELVPDGWGVIAIRLRNPSLRNGNSLIIGPADGPILKTPRGRQANVIDFFARGRGPGGTGSWFLQAVPAGRYRIDAISTALPLGFCLGAPSFGLAAGEIVYAGTFDFAGAVFGPDLALDPVNAYLADPAAQARVRPAHWRNGSLRNCLGSTAIYALEFPGAPFEEAYAWGSRAVPPAPAAP